MFRYGKVYPWPSRRGMDARRRAPARFRVVWRWNDSGQAGSSAWTRYNFVAEGWLHSLSRSQGDRITCWIETDREQPGTNRQVLAQAIERPHSGPEAAS